MSTNPSRGQIHMGTLHPKRPWQLRVGFWLFLVIAAFFLLAEHRAHLVWGLSYFPAFIFVACLVLHLFAHGGHGGHGGHGRSDHQPSSDSNDLVTRDANADVEAQTTRPRSPTVHRHGGDLP